jgi:N-acetyl-gamma-glutamyl-phosphate reductase
MVKVGIFGATGYTGFELVSILARHPQAQVQFATSKSCSGQSLRDIYPAAPNLPLIAPQEAPLDATDLVFLCLPHAAAANTAVVALQANNRVIDLSADFRLADVATY